MSRPPRRFAEHRDEHMRVGRISTGRYTPPWMRVHPRSRSSGIFSLGLVTRDGFAKTSHEVNQAAIKVSEASCCLFCHGGTGRRMARHRRVKFQWLPAVVVHRLQEFPPAVSTLRSNFDGSRRSRINDRISARWQRLNALRCTPLRCCDPSRTH